MPVDVTQFVKLQDYVSKKEVNGELVCILDAKTDKREFHLLPTYSRAITKFSIHELALTDEQEAGPNKIVNKVAYLGFFEVTEGGIIVVGDSVSVGRKRIGKIVGFDESHMPNHLNIVIKADTIATGKELNLLIGEQVTISGESD